MYWLVGASCVAITGSYLQIAGLPVIQKAILLALTLAAAIHFGINKRFLRPYLFFCLAAAGSLTFGGLSGTSQNLALWVGAFASMSIGLLVFAIRFPQKHLGRMIRALVGLPFISVAAGILGLGFGLTPWVVEYTGSVRLQGASIAPHLAMMCEVAVYRTCFCYSSTRANRYLVILAALMCMILLTGTRGALVAAALPAGYLALRQVRLKAWLVTLPVVVVLAPVLSLGASNVLLRFAQQQEAELCNASGRLVRWEYFYERTPNHFYWGHGLGAVTEATKGEVAHNLTSFTVPHNEYLRFAYDLGVIGAALFLIPLLWCLYRMRVRLGVRYVGLYLSVLVSFLLYSFVDNMFGTV